MISIIARTLEAFDEDKLIDVFGFGDVQTKGNTVFPFQPNKACYGLAEVLQRYTEITPQVILSGPTNFAPLIKEAIKIVKKKRDYHILIIITDGDVNSVKDTGKPCHIIFSSIHFHFHLKQMQSLRRLLTLFPLCVLELEMVRLTSWQVFLFFCKCLEPLKQN